MKYNIAVVSETFHTGGVGLITLQYSYTLADLGYDVSLIVIDPDNPEGVEIEKKQRLTFIPLYKPVTLKDFVSLLSKHDIVILSNTAIMPFALEASRFLKKTFVVEILHTATKAALAPSVDMTVAVSRHIYENMSPREQDTLIHNGINTDLFNPFNRSKNRLKIRIIQIAREGKIMDPDLEDIAQELIAKGYPIEAWVVGRKGISTEYITFLGLQPYYRIPELLRSSDILLHMSLEESFGMTSLEAMACGVIPVVSDAGGLTEVVEDGETGLVVKIRDREGLMQRLERLLRAFIEKDPFIEQIREKAFGRVIKEFDLRVIMSRLIERALSVALSTERLNRYNFYPFSFTAPFLFLVHRQYDRFFIVLEDVLKAEQIDSSLRDWRHFKDIMLMNIHSDHGSLLLLDRIYTCLCKDLTTSRGCRKEGVISYWLAALALSTGQLGPFRAYICKGLGCYQDNSILIRCIFSVIALWRALAGFETQGDVMRIAQHIKRCFMSADRDSIAQIPIEDSALRTIIDAWGWGGVFDPSN